MMAMYITGVITVDEQSQCGAKQLWFVEDFQSGAYWCIVQVAQMLLIVKENSY